MLDQISDDRIWYRTKNVAKSESLKSYLILIKCIKWPHFDQYNTTSFLNIHSKIDFIMLYRCAAAQPEQRNPSAILKH